MSKKSNIDSICYYPICKELGCDGILDIRFNDDFTINYKCEKNEKHTKSGLFLKTFDIFYLKKKEIQKCFICNMNLENKYQYKCLKCEKIYCKNCHSVDKHIKNNKDTLLIKTGKCEIHHPNELIYYCDNCKKPLCNDCKNNMEKNPHKNHIIKCIMDVMLSNSQIDSLKDKIKQKKSTYKKIINYINDWKNDLLKRIEKLKQNLNDEIILLEKIIYNYNPYFFNNTYHNNYYYLNNYLQSINHKDLNKFINTRQYNEQAKYIMNILYKKNIQSKNIDCILTSKYSCNYDIITKINSNLFFNSFYDNNNNLKIQLNYFQEDKICSGTDNNFNEQIYSVSSSINKDKIYACLFKEKTIKIFDIDINNKIIKDSGDVINEPNNNEHFNKCIQISENYLASTDEKMINIWNKNTGKGYSNFKKININYTNDLLLIDNNYFLVTRPYNETLYFFDIHTLNKEKSIKIQDCMYSNDCLYLIKDYVIIRGNKGLGLLSIKTKEYVQYMKAYDNSFKICLDELDHIYIYKYYKEFGKLSILKLKMIDGLLDNIKEYKCFYNIKNDDSDSTNAIIEYQNTLYEERINYEKIFDKFYIICINKKNILIFINKNIYSLNKKKIINI